MNKFEIFWFEPNNGKQKAAKFYFLTSRTNSNWKNDGYPFFFSFTLQTWTVDNKPEVKVTPCKEYKLFFSLLFNIGVVSLVLYAIYELN